MADRLRQSSSPYLRQHADNPVDWYEWGQEAFDEARRRDVPIFLSIGYAACHWCHVMAAESFADDATAEQLNRDYVAIKVDREERPDVDDIYMAILLGMTGQGGWPLSVVCNSDGAPFYAGTYYPPVDRPGMPSFRTILTSVSQAWSQRRADVDDVAAQSTAALGQLATGIPSGERTMTTGLADEASSAAHRGIDLVWGGFGSAPKFPVPLLHSGLLFGEIRRSDHPSRSTESGAGGELKNGIVTTLIRMARGGIYDQLAGGFARYSVDSQWVVPHFEKMLYDNGPLIQLYADAYVSLGSHTSADGARDIDQQTRDLFLRVVRESTQWMLAELRTEEGGLAASLDADSDDPHTGEHHEGAFYVWTPQQLREVLGEDDGQWVASRCVVTEAGTFENGASTMQLPERPDENAEDQRRWQRCRVALAAAREHRPRPARDGKVVTAWNGAAISALVRAAAVLEDRDLIVSATEIANCVARSNVVGGELRRCSLDGVASLAPGTLEDYGSLVVGFIDLAAASSDDTWSVEAMRLLDLAQDLFSRTDRPGLWWSAAKDPQLPVRWSSFDDGATPCGASTMTMALVKAANLATGDKREIYARRARSSLDAAADHLAQLPTHSGNWLATAELWWATSGTVIGR